MESDGFLIGSTFFSNHRNWMEVICFAVFALDVGMCLLRASQKCQCNEIMRQGNIPSDMVA